MGRHMSTYEHEKATERLEQAEREQERLAGRRDAAKGTGHELSAETELRGAREDAQARTRWLDWVESEGEQVREDSSGPPLEELRPR